MGLGVMRNGRPSKVLAARIAAAARKAAAREGKPPVLHGNGLDSPLVRELR